MVLGKLIFVCVSEYWLMYERHHNCWEISASLHIMFYLFFHTKHRLSVLFCNGYEYILRFWRNDYNNRLVMNFTELHNVSFYVLVLMYNINISFFIFMYYMEIVTIKYFNIHNLYSPQLLNAFFHKHNTYIYRSHYN